MSSWRTKYDHLPYMDKIKALLKDQDFKDEMEREQRITDSFKVGDIVRMETFARGPAVVTKIIPSPRGERHEGRYFSVEGWLPDHENTDPDCGPFTFCTYLTKETNKHNLFRYYMWGPYIDE